MELHRETFAKEELEKAPPKKRPVILKSGGCVMELESVEDGIALCSWENNERKLQRASFPLVCLYECRPMES